MKRHSPWRRLARRVRTCDSLRSSQPLRTLADVVHPYPAFNRILGAAFGQLASKVA